LIFEPLFFEEIQAGTTRNTLARTVTETDIVIHAGQTGDFFPHHMDAEWMKTQSAGQRVAHGTLVLSIAVGLTAFSVNPEAMSYGYDSIRFVKPVFIGDTIRASAEIVEKLTYDKSPSEFGKVHEIVRVMNQRHELVLVLTHIYLVKRINAK
jgi:acyl dehydratase